MKKINIQYFAVFREQRGLSEEVVETTSALAGDLYNELALKHGFGLEPRLVRASVNLKFVPLDSEVNDGDTVVFIPPVAGG